ncbi:MAG TPA: sigma-70 family RNA polymerase sigma factor [Candidatus Angelobacter sp.]|nr:sigma-70 family RNA polymerase sigma factor [Candidatus Angelobacter sp.]
MQPQPSETSIRELLDLCLRTEEERHWQEFVRRTQPLIAKVIINTLRRWCEPSPSLVDDLVQDTFLKLFANDRKALRSIRNEHEYAIFGFLKVIASNVTFDHGRRQKNIVAEIELDDVVVPPSPDGFDRIQFKRLKDQIETCLCNLSSSETYERDVGIFWLYYDQGYSAREISELTGIGLTVKGVEAVVQRLTRFIKESGIGPPGTESG